MAAETKKFFNEDDFYDAVGLFDSRYAAQGDIPEVPVKAVKVDGEDGNLVPDANGTVTIPAAPEVPVKGIKANGGTQVIAPDADGVVELPAAPQVPITAATYDGSALTPQNGTIAIPGNPIETVKVNGTPLVPSDKAVDITIDESAEENQNAFSKVKVGSDVVESAAKTDQIELEAGANVQLAVSGKKITVSAEDTTYDAAVAGGADGLMTGADKAKLDTVASGAQANVLEGVQVAGVDLVISGKKVNIPVATGESGVGTFMINGVQYAVYGLGAAAAAGIAASIADGEAGLVSGDQVYDYVAARLSATYKPGGSIAPAAVGSSLLVEANLGNVYNLSADLTLDAATAPLFVDGAAGEKIAEGTNIVVVASGNGYLLDALSGFVDLSDYVETSDISDMETQTHASETYVAKADMPTFTRIGQARLAEILALVDAE